MMSSAISSFCPLQLGSHLEKNETFFNNENYVQSRDETSIMREWAAFFVLYGSKLNVFGFWAAGQIKHLLESIL